MWNGLRRTSVGAAALAVLVTATHCTSARGQATAATPAGTPLYVSANGSDSGGCSKQSPCRTFNAAYHRASPGQAVQVAGGSYGDQTITADTTKAAANLADVTFAPAPGAQVSVGELRIEGRHVQFSNMTADDFYVGINRNSPPQTSQAAYVTLRNMTAKIFFISGASNVRVLGGSIGPAVDNAAQIDDCSGCTYHASHITIDGVRFHDFVRQTPGIHMECLHVYPADDLVIRNSRFQNCAIFDVLINNYGELGSASGFTIENNFFDRPGSGEPAGSLSDGNSALEFTPFGAGGEQTLSNITVRNNTFLSTLLFDPASGSFQNAVVAGNVGQMASFSCPNVAGVVFSHNVWYSDYSPPGHCGSTDRSLNGGHDAIKFASYPTDLHLQRGSPALGAGDPQQAPATDSDGQPRPRAMAPDAGADQREAASFVPGRALGDIRLGASRTAVLAFYGPPSGSSKHSLDKGGPRVQVDRYRLHGGVVWVAYDNDRVIGAGTTSRYYSTVAGTGVGEKLAPRLARPTKACPGTVRQTTAGAVVTYGAAKDGSVRSLAMVLPRYVGDGCGPKA
jgi:hypothetical protein